MNDLSQVVVVTMAAALALLVMVRPYLRKTPAATPPCANCPGASRRHRPDAPKPLTFVFPVKPR